MPLVGGRAAAAAIYPHKLCCAICRGLAEQIRADEGWRFETPLPDSNGLKILNHACQEASSQELFFLVCGTDIGTASPHAFDNRVSDGVAERIMSLVERTNGEEINVLKTLRVSDICLCADKVRPQCYPNGGRGGETQRKIQAQKIE